MDAIKPKTYREKWPVGCQFCDLLLCDGKKEKYEVVTMNKAGIPREVLTFEYDHKCVPCKPTQPECGECEFAKPQTNADRIRAISDEELAEYFPTHASLCPDLEENKMMCKGANFMANDEMCHQCWLNWLKQEK